MKPDTKLAFTTLLLLAVAACTSGEEDDPTPDPPTVAMLAPEPGQRARENLAVAGTASGNLRDVGVRVDGGEPREAEGLEEWFYLLDVTPLADGSHTVSAIATDEDEATAESPAISFVSTAAQPPGTTIVGGTVRGSDQELLAGASISVHEGTRTTPSDLNGRYAMVGLDPAEEVILVGELSGYADTYMPSFAPSGDVADFDVSLFPQGALDFLAGACDVVREDGLGTLVGFLVDAPPAESGFAGAAIALDGATGDGPCHADAAGDFDPARTHTSEAGVYVFFNVSTGPVAVTASAEGVTFFLLESVAAADAVTVLFGRAE